MNRTGVDFKSNWDELVCDISERPNIQFLGIHIYDGHFTWYGRSKNKRCIQKYFL